MIPHLGKGKTFCQCSPDRDFVRPAGLWVVQQGKLCERQACIRNYVRQMQVDSPLLTPGRQSSMILIPSSCSTVLASQDLQMSMRAPALRRQGGLSTSWANQTGKCWLILTPSL